MLVGCHTCTFSTVMFKLSPIFKNRLQNGFRTQASPRFPPPKLDARIYQSIYINVATGRIVWSATWVSL